MSDFQGKFQYLGGAAAQEGACRVHFDKQTFTLTPDSGTALVFDLGDLDAVSAANWEIRLPLYTGRTVVLRQFGKAYETLAHDLTEAYRNRILQCMLLEDLAEVALFNGNVEVAGGAAGAAEIRLYKSNLAVLPATACAFQWRLADIDDVKLDSSAYEIAIQSGGERLRVSRLAKRTEEFAAKLRECMNALATESTQALHAMLPFLDPDQLQACASLLREGRSALVAKLGAIHKQIPAALAANAVDKDLKPYYDQLVAKAAAGMGYVGFKLLRPEAEDAPDTADNVSTEDNADDEASEASDAGAPETLYWFLFPMTAKSGGSAPANVVAWEASSRSGRATYFFRLTDPAQAGQLTDPARAAAIVDASVRRLNRVLALLNFRRRPIYLSDDELAMNPQFHRYAIAARRMPEVREVRASFLGRALHSSPDAWQAQVDNILDKAK